ncbi:MAG: cbb3-type cytochrome c oxidase N-terminal domain-containing protein, partial [Saprospiraceae bacterium]
SAFLGVPNQIAGIDSWILIGLVFIICAELMIILVLTRTVKRIMLGLGFQPEPLTKEDKPWFNWSMINRKLTDSVPVESEESILTNHNYDGIHELDNNLPPWWKYGFYLTIAFAIYYMLDYHVFKISPLQLDEYKTELVNADIEKKARLSEKAANVDESSVVQLKDELSLTNGEEIFLANCVACHGKFGEGGVGPNFTDEYWIHGGGIKDVFTTIKYGVPAKGMISWQNQLTPEAMQKVASYILSFQGSHPANPKAPQGELWKEVPRPPVDTIAK